MVQSIWIQVARRWLHGAGHMHVCMSVAMQYVHPKAASCVHTDSPWNILHDCVRTLQRRARILSSCHRLRRRACAVCIRTVQRHGRGPRGPIIVTVIYSFFRSIRPALNERAKELVAELGLWGFQLGGAKVSLNLAHLGIGRHVHGM